MTDKRLEGQTAIVTGAARGIGRAIIREFAASGANVVINHITDTCLAKDLAEEVSNEFGVRTLVVRANVADYEQVTTLIQETIRAFNRIDILINNAGITRDKTIKKMTKEQWDEVIHVNLDSVFNCTRQVLPYMIERNRGRIVSLSSFVALAGNFGQANYAATKAGIIGFTKTVALEVARNNITVNAICPGFIDTDMLQNVPEEIRRSLIERIPLGRFGKPEEVAACIRYIVSEADYMTGQAISLNGGVYI
jgi:3-oxoacyl-(acyl-carrier-protein) reductase